MSGAASAERRAAVRLPSPPRPRLSAAVSVVAPAVSDPVNRCVSASARTHSPVRRARPGATAGTAAPVRSATIRSARGASRSRRTRPVRSRGAKGSPDPAASAAPGSRPCGRRCAGEGRAAGGREGEAEIGAGARDGARSRSQAAMSRVAGLRDRRVTSPSTVASRARPTGGEQRSAKPVEPALNSMPKPARSPMVSRSASKVRPSVASARSIDVAGDEAGKARLCRPQAQARVGRGIEPGSRAARDAQQQVEVERLGGERHVERVAAESRHVERDAAGGAARGGLRVDVVQDQPTGIGSDAGDEFDRIVERAHRRLLAVKPGHERAGARRLKRQGPVEGDITTKGQAPETSAAASPGRRAASLSMRQPSSPERRSPRRSATEPPPTVRPATSRLRATGRAGAERAGASARSAARASRAAGAAGRRAGGRDLPEGRSPPLRRPRQGRSRDGPSPWRGRAGPRHRPASRLAGSPAPAV